MSRGPGRYRCTTYLKAWALGAKGWADEHIDHCSFCHPIVHGDGKHFIGSITEAAEQLHLSRLKRRRRFLVAGTALGLLALTGSLAYLLPSRANQGPPQQDGPIFAASMQELDRVFAGSGKPAIARIVQLGSEEQVVMAVQWIADRGHSALADILLIAATDSRVQVRVIAVDSLMRLPPVDLKPFLPQLNALAASEAEDGLRALLQELAVVVQNA
ncbi:MAG: hypothetical protein R3F20_15060 [Planctomycetota bacterium]